MKQLAAFLRFPKQTCSYISLDKPHRAFVLPAVPNRNFWFSDVGCNSKGYWRLESGPTEYQNAKA